MADNRWTWERDLTETNYARGRVAGRTYLSKIFVNNRESSPDFGELCRFVYKVLDTTEESTLELEGSAWVVRTTPAGRFQIKVMICRDEGRIKDLWIQRVPGPGLDGPTTTLLHLDEPHVGVMAEFFRLLEHVPLEGDGSVRVDDAMLRDVLSNAHNVESLYRRNPDAFRQLIRDDETGGDLLALGHRKREVARFRRLIDDDAYFDAEARGVGEEAVWQRYFEENPWILGATLTGQLLTTWDQQKLEQVVTGASAFSTG